MHGSHASYNKSKHHYLDLGLNLIITFLGTQNLGLGRIQMKDKILGKIGLTSYEEGHFNKGNANLGERI